MADLSRLSNADLKALQNGDLKSVSNDGLRILSGNEAKVAKPSAGTSNIKEALLGAPANILDGLANATRNIVNTGANALNLPHVPQGESVRNMLGLPQAGIADNAVQGLASVAPYLMGGEEAGLAKLGSGLKGLAARGAVEGSVYGGTQNPQNPAMGALLGGSLGAASSPAGALAGSVLKAPGTAVLNPVLNYIAKRAGAIDRAGNRLLPNARTPEEAQQLLQNLKGFPTTLGQLTNVPGVKALEKYSSMLPFSGAEKNQLSTIAATDNHAKNLINHLSGGLSADEIPGAITSAVQKAESDAKDVMNQQYNPINEFAKKSNFIIQERPNLQRVVNNYLKGDSKKINMGLQKPRPEISANEAANMKNIAYPPFMEKLKNSNLQLLKQIQSEYSGSSPLLNQTIRGLAKQTPVTKNIQPLGAQHFAFLNQLKQEIGDESPTLIKAMNVIKNNPLGKNISFPSFQDLRDLESSLKNEGRNQGASGNLGKQKMYNDLASAVRDDYDHNANLINIPGVTNALSKANENAKLNYYDVFNKPDIEEIITGTHNPNTLYNTLVKPENSKLLNSLPQDVKNKIYLNGLKNNIKDSGSGVEITPANLAKAYSQGGAEKALAKKSLLDSDTQKQFKNLIDMQSLASDARVANANVPTGAQAIPYIKAGLGLGAITNPLTIIPGIGANAGLSAMLRNPRLLEAYANLGAKSAPELSNKAGVLAKAGAISAARGR